MMPVIETHSDKVGSTKRTMRLNEECLPSLQQVGGVSTGHARCKQPGQPIPQAIQAKRS